MQKPEVILGNEAVLSKAQRQVIRRFPGTGNYDEEQER